MPKRILFDFISLQDKYINGGAICTQMILFELIKQKQIIIGLYDNRKQFPESLEQIVNDYNIELFSITEKKTLLEFIETKHIDLLFIGISQRYNNINLTNIQIKIILICHDISDKALLYGNKIYNKNTQKFYISNAKYSSKAKLKQKIVFYISDSIFSFLLKERINNNYLNFSQLISKDNVYVVTVSEYSKNALNFYFNVKNDIQVIYPPLKNLTNSTKILDVDSTIEKLLNNKKFFLLISSERINKNIKVFIDQWKRFCQTTNNTYYAVLIGKLSIKMDNIICINYVSDSSLEWLYQKAFAFVYPSIYEGFGYPPLECMKYGTPAIVSNVTSLPEVYNDSVIYFSPFYPEDLYMAMKKITKFRDYYSKKGLQRFNDVINKQKSNLERLVNYIIE